MILQGLLPVELPTMQRVSNLVKNKLPKIIENDKKNRLSMYPGNEEIIQGIEDGFLNAIQKLKEEKKCQK